MYYSHFGNEVCNWAISIKQRGFIDDCFKVYPLTNGEKNLVRDHPFQMSACLRGGWSLMAIGFVDHLGLNQSFKTFLHIGILVPNVPNTYFTAMNILGVA